MIKEIQALEQNHTWILSSPPPGKHVIDSKWIFRVKYHSDGTIERYKAHVVAKGYTQVEGNDYHTTTGGGLCIGFRGPYASVLIRCISE
ncbi:unnamed protein product [Rhodiola kirilowii]